MYKRNCFRRSRKVAVLRTADPATCERVVEAAVAPILVAEVHSAAARAVLLLLALIITVRRGVKRKLRGLGRLRPCSLVRCRLGVSLGVLLRVKDKGRARRLLMPLFTRPGITGAAVSSNVLHTGLVIAGHGRLTMRHCRYRHPVPRGMRLSRTSPVARANVLVIPRLLAWGGVGIERREEIYLELVRGWME